MSSVSRWPGITYSGSSRGRIVGSLPSCGAPCGAAPPDCPDRPCVPPQGAVMPVLYNPGQATNLNPLAPGDPSVYTLNLVTTAVIPRGVLLRFQMYDGVNLTYSQAAALGSAGIAQWDLVVATTIPVGTVVAVVVTPTSTGIVGFTGSAVYASGGAGVLPALLQPTNSCLCWAFALALDGGWAPATGQPQFAIGFSWSAATQGPVCAVDDPAPIVGPPTTAPNFPDQWCLTSALTWTFLYEVVFPLHYTVETLEGEAVLSLCESSTAFKVAYDPEYPIYAVSEWSNLRDVLAQPWTVVMPTAVTPSRWVNYDGTGATDDANVGRFELAAGPGQLAVVYFHPRHQDLGATGIDPAPGPGSYTGPGRLAALVTSPLPAHTVLQITFQPYNSYYGGFGPRDPLPSAAPGSSPGFITANPDIVWTVGQFVIPAGTVLFFDNLGSSSLAPTVVDAHNTTGNRVGSLAVPPGSATERAVDSVMILSNWLQTTGSGAIRPVLADRFVTAIMSTDYCGDQPPLSPMLTMQRTRVYGAVAFGLGEIFNNSNLPGTVQAAIINSSTLTPLTEAASLALTPADMPTFVGMTDFYW